MAIGIIYFLVIVVANSLGAISGMGGGVLIKPVLDLIGHDSVAAVSFYSSVAVLTMSIVATCKQVCTGEKLKWQIIGWIALGAAGGGLVGKNVLVLGLNYFPEKKVLAVQIIVTVVTILFAFLRTRFEWQSWTLSGVLWYLGCGLILGFFASFLGIGGGPINVALLMLMFNMPIKDATVYSICIILFSQAAKVTGIVFAGEYAAIDLRMLWFIIPAGIVGGYVGSMLSHSFNATKVELVFQSMLLIVVLVNVYNGITLFV